MVNTKPNPTPQNARCASLDQIMATVIAAYLTPIPERPVLRRWFRDAGIPCFKANPLAKKGGGPCYYSVSHVEKFLAARTGKAAL